MKIEAGEFYQDASGNKVGPMKRAHDEPFTHMWFTTNEVGRWTDQGHSWNGARSRLVSAWVDDVYSEGDTQPIASATQYSGERNPFANPVSHPPHYTGHPSGVECIQITEHMNFNRGNAVKYIWRAGEKGAEIQDLEKAVWYLQREIARIKK